jgi:hypothetical protein
MCLPAIGAAIGSVATAIGGAVGGLTAAGAGAGAMTIGGLLQGVGAVAGVAGALYQNRQTRDFARAQVAGQEALLREQTAVLQDQARTEAQVTAVTDQRRRQEFFRTIRQQTAELAARGVSLDSPTAILLGQTAAQELSFDSQATRADGAARQREIAGGLRAAGVQSQTAITDIRAQARKDRLNTTIGAVGSALTGATTIWPGLADTRIGRKALS